MIPSTACGRGRGPLDMAEWEGEGVSSLAKQALTLPALRASLPLPQVVEGR